jgi:hypothetical protein
MPCLAPSVAAPTVPENQFWMSRFAVGYLSMGDTLYQDALTSNVWPADDEVWFVTGKEPWCKNFYTILHRSHWRAVDVVETRWVVVPSVWH